ncbi:MAG: MerR family transcriptional regulator [Planctomycetota bacterium]
MAGMFYSLQEAAEKLNKTEEELKQLVEEGTLREFRDGPNLLFKVDEIDGLMSEAAVIGPEEAEEVSAAEALDLDFAEPEIQEAEIPEAEIPELEVPEAEISEAEIPEQEIPEAEIPEAEAALPELEEEEFSVAEPEESAEPAADTDEILLAPETGTPVASSDLTDADTALTGLGTSVLGETDQDYEVTDDTMAETAIPAGTAGTTPEVPLAEIEEDVNLDSFGSGSGLLDLSLQADDTSLGGILDEIYTAEGEGQEPAEAEAEGDSAAVVAVEPEQMVTDDELAASQPAPEAVALAAPVIETAPDAQSNTLGMLLFLPLVIVVYTTVVAVAGLRGVMPSILSSVQSFIWYIMGGAAGLALLVTGAAFLLTGERSAKAVKEKKPKKPKKVKEPKAKKVKEKKPKKVKEKKPKKPKKSK